MNNLNIMNKEKCCGCNVCAEICPQHAIKMIENDEGFLEYSIDEKLCINCGLCLKKCPQFNEMKNNKNFVQQYYASSIKSVKDIKKSSSGGIFQIIAKEIAKNKEYAIFGAIYDENLKVKHSYIDNENDIDKLLGSKYAQSDISNIYKVVREKLDKNIKVLFSGTPCQVAGLYSYLGKKEYDNLITVDLICHGVPSPLLFQKYIEYLGKKYNGKVEEFNFRSKIKKEWGKNCLYKIGKRNFYKPYYLEAYYYNFIKGTISRKSCYECKYANKERVADITLGDYWGIQDFHPKIYNKLGNSLIIINTMKGEKLFENIKNGINYEQSSYSNASKYNHTLNKPTPKADSRDSIYKNIRKDDFVEKFSQYLLFKPSLKNIIKSKIPPFVKTLVKNIRRKLK